MTYITRIANKRILAKYFLYSLQINYLHWKLSASRSVFSCYATNSAFNYVDVPTRVIQSSVNLITSRRLVNLVLGIRKQYAGLLLWVIKCSIH